ncbi:MAG: hypothetical protein M0Z34_09390 [Nitrospiraceae bacterium]|nr:hypothetical protein [Nitrospiraceae bacterium]
MGRPGAAEVSASSFIQIQVSTYQAGGFAGISFQVAAPSSYLRRLFSSARVSGEHLAGSYSARIILSGLSQGNHALKLQHRRYADATGTDFAERFIVAQGF